MFTIHPSALEVQKLIHTCRPSIYHQNSTLEVQNAQNCDTKCDTGCQLPHQGDGRLHPVAISGPAVRIDDKDVNYLDCKTISVVPQPQKHTYIRVIEACQR